MYLNNEKDRAYLLSSTIKQYIYYYGVNKTIYALFNSNNECITYHTENCFKKENNTKIYKTTLECLYIYLLTHFHFEIDFFLLKMIEKKNLYNISSIEMANTLGITPKKYNAIETGEVTLTNNQRRAVSLKLKITSNNKHDFFKNNFKLIINNEFTNK